MSTREIKFRDYDKDYLAALAQMGMECPEAIDVSGNHKWVTEEEKEEVLIEWFTCYRMNYRQVCSRCGKATTWRGELNQGASWEGHWTKVHAKGEEYE